MAKLKFELFITTVNGQQSFLLEQTPLMFGSGPNCDIQMGSGEPTVKAILQREDDVLLIKVFDVTHPISINGKKYKTAKIKNSSFFKIGNIDIVASIEEIVDQHADEILDEFSEDNTNSEILEDYIDESNEQSSQVFVAPSLATQMLSSHSQPDSLPEEKPIEATNTNIKVSKLLHGELPVAPTQEVAQQLPVGLMNNLDEDDEFQFNIHFDEESYVPVTLASYSDKQYDYSNYIDPKDETLKELPEEIHEEIEGHCLHIVHMNNGVTIEEEHFAPESKRIYVSNEFSDRKTIQIMDSDEYKSELIFVRDRKVFVVGQKGYILQKVDELDNVINIETATVQLIHGERVILSKGTSQIVVSIVKTPPRLLHKNFFDFEDEVVKVTAMVWALCIIPLLGVMLFAELPQQKPKIKKELVVIYKKKQLKEPEKKEVEKPQETAKTEPQKEAEKKQAEPAKAPEKKVAEKEPVKKKEKIVKKVAQENPVKQKVVKETPKVVDKAPKVATKVAVQKSVAKPAPKKTYKFSSSSKLSAVVGSNNTQLKTARSTSSVDVASTMGSTSSLTQSYNTNKFGKSGVRVETFGSGSPNGSKAGIGTSGLSGKSGASTAYIDANTKILGAMDPELIRKIMKEFIPQFRYCYQKEIMRTPSAEGTFDLEFQINAYGKGINVGVRKNGQDFSVNAQNCLKRVVKMIPFPKPKGGGLVDVRQPMNFYKQ